MVKTKMILMYHTWSIIYKILDMHSLHVNNVQCTRIFSSMQGTNVVIMFNFTLCMHSSDNFVALLIINDIAGRVFASLSRD